MCMSKEKRNLIIIITMLCLIIGSINVTFAATNKASLTPSQKWKFSVSYFSGKRAYLTYGKNYSSSKHSVYFIHAVYDSENAAKTPSKYSQDAVKLVKAGKSFSTAVSSSSFSSKKYFRLLLNPYGENTTGCTADGTQKDSK